MIVGRSEQAANFLGEVTNLLSLCALFLLAIFNSVGILAVDAHLAIPALLLGTVIFLSTIVISRATGRKSPCLRYLHLLSALLLPTLAVAVNGFSYSLAFVIPIGLSCCYLNRKILFASFITIVVLLPLAAGANACWGIPDVSMIDLPSDTLVPWRYDIEHVMEEIGYDRGAYFFNVIRYQYIPNLVFLVVCMILADGAIRVARARAEVAEAFSRGLLDSIGKERAV